MIFSLCAFCLFAAVLPLFYAPETLSEKAMKERALKSYADIAKRMKDLIIHVPNFSINDIHLLKMGRHFRLSHTIKLVVGRNEEENQKIQTFAQEKDILLKVSSFPGPLSLLRGKPNGGDIEKASAITAHYCKAKNLGKIEVTYKLTDEDRPQSLFVSPISRVEIERLMINE
jgi:predicted ribosome quality control (RQC) complex YloA/Tae2 family protein